MTAEPNRLGARRHTVNPLPSTGPQLQLAELFPPYMPASVSTFPEYTLTRDDIDAAFEERDETNWAHHRLQRMNLRCVALEQLMDSSDQPRAVAESQFGDQPVRAESVKIALLEINQEPEMKAIGSFGRICQLPKSDSNDTLLRVRYTLESLRVLPAHRGKGFDRSLAAGMAALMARELESLTETLWHTQTLAVQVRLTSRLDAASGVLKRIVSTRLRDELVAQDSMLQLDGKLSRFLPLGN
ncbi:MAG: hypothetical protein OEN20_13170 [Gammaproteobacteria bacterium]|nr:hypothetical protein [Gammaproteobacteria bacterium]